MSADVTVIEITIRRIANGYIGYVEVGQNYTEASTPTVFYPTLEDALSSTRDIAANPELIASVGEPMEPEF